MREAQGLQVTEYVHVPPGQEFEGIGGRYVVEREARLSVGGRDVLVVYGYAVVDRSCCGVGGVIFAGVPGYVVAWNARTAKDGSAVTEVEPVTDAAARKEIRDFIRRSDPHRQVNFG